VHCESLTQVQVRKVSFYTELPIFYNDTKYTYINMECNIFHSIYKASGTGTDREFEL